MVIMAPLLSYLFILLRWRRYSKTEFFVVALFRLINLPGAVKRAAENWGLLVPEAGDSVENMNLADHNLLLAAEVHLEHQSHTEDHHSRAEAATKKTSYYITYIHFRETVVMKRKIFFKNKFVKSYGKTCEESLAAMKENVVVTREVEVRKTPIRQKGLA